MGYSEKHMKGCLKWSRRGQSLVEFALIAPLLLALLFVIVELGIVFSIYLGLTNSAREAARTGSVYQYDTPKALVGKSLSDALKVVDPKREQAMRQVITDTLHPLTDAAQLDAKFEYTPAATNFYRYGDKVTVTLSYPHPLFFNVLGPLSITLNAHSEMRLEPGGL